MTKLTIVVFKNDLRIHDHPAIYEAAKDGNILPVYIKNTEYKRRAKEVWIDQSLKVLQTKFDNLNQSFLILQGQPKDVLSHLISETGATQVNWNVSFTKEGRQADKNLREHLNKLGIQVNEFNGQTLYRFKNIYNQAGAPYKIFTPFYKKCLQEEVIKPYPKPQIEPYKYEGNFISEEIANGTKLSWCILQEESTQDCNEKIHKLASQIYLVIS